MSFLLNRRDALSDIKKRGSGLFSSHFLFSVFFQISDIFYASIPPWLSCKYIWSAKPKPAFFVIIVAYSS